MAATGVAAAAVPSWPGTALASSGSQAEEPSSAAGLIRLDRTVNAYGPSVKVAAAVYEAAARIANGDASVAAEALRARIANVHGVGPDRVIVGCGSGEVLRLAVEAYAGPRKKIVAAVPTSELIEESPNAQAPRSQPFLSTSATGTIWTRCWPAPMLRSDSSTSATRTTPTGTLTRRQAIEEFLRRLPSTVYVLIDEAHHHYVDGSRDYASFLDRPVDDPRVIVVRSFSNVYGLSGLRVGYGVATPATVRSLRGIQLPDSVNAVGSAAAIAALEDTGTCSAVSRGTSTIGRSFSMKPAYGCCG